ncbi:hypothetical protein [Paraburkholderia haematera]|uniref:hypothetical protein n=1 Tax=Paraburkholderia haematera TaxID=2793077 RepID=UPI001B8C582D|nr:hypothetical protein [Paraburkholderia haematera]
MDQSVARRLQVHGRNLRLKEQITIGNVSLQSAVRALSRTASLCLRTLEVVSKINSSAIYESEDCKNCIGSIAIEGCRMQAVSLTAQIAG